MNYKYNFGNKKDEKKKKIIFLIIIAILALIIAIFAVAKVEKLQNAVKKPFVYIGKFFSSTKTNISNSFKSKETIIEENERLSNEVEKLKLQLIETQGILDENISLKKMLEIENKYKHYELKYASITYVSMDNYNYKYTINIGTKDGVKLYDPVIHGEGLVGYISNVNEDSSIITTLLDTSFSASVTISSIRQNAIVCQTSEYKDKKMLKLKDIPIEGEIAVGDVIYTSGIGTIYPSSIPIGVIAKIEGNKNESSRYANISMNVNIENIREVAVIVG